MANMKITLKEPVLVAWRSTSQRLILWGLRRSIDVTVQPDNAQTRGKVKQIGYLLENRRGGVTHEAA